MPNFPQLEMICHVLINMREGVIGTTNEKE